jgi:hypothetical protein
MILAGTNSTGGKIGNVSMALLLCGRIFSPAIATAGLGGVLAEFQTNPHATPGDLARAFIEAAAGRAVFFGLSIGAAQISLLRGGLSAFRP